jgi:hypothetical protein
MVLAQNMLNLGSHDGATAFVAMWFSTKKWKSFRNVLVFMYNASTKGDFTSLVVVYVISIIGKGIPFFTYVFHVAYARMQSTFEPPFCNKLYDLYADYQ